jgi:protein-S-isoprenylcysteine O-methyltransferase Ste14
MVEYGYGHWDVVILNIMLFSLFLLFIPFRRKVAYPQKSIYLAFITALFAEMYGFPLTIYILTAYFGYSNPLTHEAGHLLYPEQGMMSPFHILSNFMILGGIILIIAGWRKIHNAGGKLVTEGVYRHIRHPQYLGLLLLASGLLIQWTTLLTALMWPVLIYLYVRLAKREEKEMEEKFGEAYLEYKRGVPMFIPFPKIHVTAFSDRLKGE